MEWAAVIEIVHLGEVDVEAIRPTCSRIHPRHMASRDSALHARLEHDDRPRLRIIDDRPSRQPCRIRPVLGVAMDIRVIARGLVPFLHRTVCALPRCTRVERLRSTRRTASHRRSRVRVRGRSERERVQAASGQQCRDHTESDNNRRTSLPLAGVPLERKHFRHRPRLVEDPMAQISMIGANDLAMSQNLGPQRL